ncbi:ABC transporter permease subunit [Phytohabitans sp. ZYX-F-186]|uniref:ABC transporter permease subunit n=1 Tax=Phytohabitans maris TaxID=3071409 RepID=A0ABU0ZHU0_9ACTN|nr:ABC transporter permease subunit [Phytohabitans sp. ZYX-F-186]MDQ7906619.1 ABC transporter permease subunit [Phytohabitans sp. ZYX-F-186]
MSGLIRAEVRRLAKRRVTRLMVILLVLGLGAIGVAFTVASQKVGPAQVAAAEAEAQRQYEEALRWHQQMVADCEAAKARGEDITQRFPPDCGNEPGYAPQREQFDATWNLPYEFHFRDQFGVFISVFAGIVALFGFIVGASYVGAEWHSGGMMNLLLWRPRRLSVLFTKLGVLLGGVLAVTVVLGALWTVGFWLIGTFDGQTGEMTQGAWESFALSGARGAGLVLAVTAVAFGLASVGRHTAMALGVAIGVGVVSEIGMRIALAIAQVRFAERWVLSTYALAWFEKRWELQDWRACNISFSGQCEPDTFVITWQQSALVFGLGTAVVLAAAIWLMRSRDIT